MKGGVDLVRLDVFELRPYNLAISLLAREHQGWCDIIDIPYLLTPGDTPVELLESNGYTCRKPIRNAPQ